MKTPTRLCLVFVMVAVASTMVYAGRPQCTSPFTPGPRVCFTDLGPLFGYDWQVAIAGSLDNFNTEGTTAVFLWKSNDFVRTMPDGSLALFYSDARADVYVCRSGGYEGCLGAWLATFDGVTYPPPPLPDMLVGTATVTAMIRIGPTAPGCPQTLQGHGTVMDMDPLSSTYGTEYVLSAHGVWIRTPGREEGCTGVFQSVTLTPKQ